MNKDETLSFLEIVQEEKSNTAKDVFYVALNIVKFLFESHPLNEEWTPVFAEVNPQIGKEADEFAADVIKIFRDGVNESLLEKES